MNPNLAFVLASLLLGASAVTGRQLPEQLHHRDEAHDQPGAHCTLPKAPTAVDTMHNVTYHGVSRNNIEIFLGVHYGLDTGGAQRFKPSSLYVPSPNSVVDATAYGPACPQPLGPAFRPLLLTDVTEISEDCLHLNIARPKGTKSGDRLPVVVFIHGGSFWVGQNREITNAPDGMILESVKNGLPVIHVHIQYRLGVFGFAKTDALKVEKSMNAGLRDMRLAMEWVRANIDHFGGNPDHLTAWGQSSSGLGVAMNVMAYGGSKPIPFQQGVCQSQCLEPGITGNVTRNAMKLVVDATGCNSTDINSPETIRCLRSLPMTTLEDAAIATYAGDIGHNVGDIWLPAVDDDFLPALPSELLRQGRFAKGVNMLIGWADDDLNIYTEALNPEIKSENDSRTFIQNYLPAVSSQNIDKLMQLYPVSEFADKGSISAYLYRSSRIFRDVLMTCQPIYFGQHMAHAGGANVFLYDWNQTMLEPGMQVELHPGGPLGPVHTSEYAYVYGNLSHYNIYDYPFAPTEADVALARRGSRSWSTYFATGVPGGMKGKEVFQGVRPAFDGSQIYLHVSGGPDEGISAVDGPDSHDAIAKERIRERCAFLNSPQMIEQMQW